MADVRTDSVEAVKRVLGETLQLGPRAQRFDADTRLLGALPELDSMAVVSILTAMEEAFDITVADDEVSAETFETVGSLARYVERKRAG